MITIEAIVGVLNEELVLNPAEATDGSGASVTLALRNTLRWLSRQGNWKCLHKTATAALVNGTTNIAQPADFNNLDAITLNDGTYNKEPLTPLEDGYNEWLTNRHNEPSNNYSEPKHYAERGTTYYLDPISDTDYTATLAYWAIHATDAAGLAAIAFPDVFELALCYAVISNYLNSKGRHEKAVYYRALAEAELDELRDGFEDKITRPIKYNDL
jgi:hypothetical protein